MEKIRLSKRMSELGLCSRREADRYIERGMVEVDGEIVSKLGSKVHAGQKVILRPPAQNTQQQRVTILLNKPIGYVSGQAEHNHKPAITLIDNHTRWSGDESPVHFHRSQMLGLAPAGRLDIDSQGLLVLTQDGRIAKRLIGEDSKVDKEYLVRVQGKLNDGGLALLCQGLKLDGKYLKPAKVTWQNEDQLRFVLQEGKKRQIRRMCELVGLKVTGLKRIRVGKVKLGKLPAGQWRYLGENEQF
jgi:23S rRNA pseudouridine2604 synthase